MGTATQHDNARVLNLTNPTIANFRSGTTTPPPSGNELQNNQPITVNGAKNSEQLFTFTAPSGTQQVTITTSGGTGDLDLYVKYNGAASSNNYDCRPYKNGNNESCSDNRSGGYSIMVKGYTAFSNVSLTASYQ
ncbi:PPC domain-containing protein [Pseudoalteromonas sp. KG3]|nr:PPC domain-containing protein [Pseudoalteromonas sp. KG3]WKD22248.1 PPC domain-containing protein [Pseudoalteromonas sp. KG3]